MQKATPQHTKEHNKRLVLKTIYEGGQMSRADIARSTSLTRTTVSNIVAELIADRLVVETGLAPSAGGKPPTLLNIDEDSFQCLCVDLGSQAFRGALVNLRGKITHRLNIPVNDSDGELALAHGPIIAPVPVRQEGLKSPDLPGLEYQEGVYRL